MVHDKIAHTSFMSLLTFQARLSNVVEADPDVSAAMDMLSFALYHENTKVIGEDTAEPSLGEKRQREVSDSSDIDGNDAQRQRTEENAGSNSGDETPAAAPQGDQSLAELKAAVYAEVTRSLEDCIVIDDICTNVEDRALVARAVQSLEEDGKIMQSDGEVYLID